MQSGDNSNSDRGGRSSKSSRDKSTGRGKRSFNTVEMEIAEFMADMPLGSIGSRKPSTGVNKPSRDESSQRALTERGGRLDPSMKDVLSGPITSQSSSIAHAPHRKEKRAKHRPAQGSQTDRELEIAELMAATGSKPQLSKHEAALAMADLALQTPLSASRTVHAAAQPTSRVQTSTSVGPSRTTPAGPSQPGPAQRGPSQRGPSHPGTSIDHPVSGAAQKPEGRNNSHECRKCGRAFNTQGAALDHQYECKIVLACSKCSFQAGTKAYLAKHERMHFERVCHVCGFTTIHGQAFKNHKKTHESSTCEICGARYTRRDTLKRHMKDKHPQQ
ncbi:Replication initiator 1 [Gracilariopsis chorda]|uniref:Replication initiator 1 n=1 Tax=Gracilariopsis chorda TaxID=448386 RepID=A0A2V3IM58_9FLOR|nr:Replication initiator 1 [Gracilariopsis chorda]|eukprot:PXF43127.1 Replication initiator 1 [Gracilariopsis chorda]